MTIEMLKEQGCLLFECVSGSRAYGTDLPTSDTDLKGVFVLPQKLFYGLEYVAQVSSEKNDEIYYELRRFTELLWKNNPNLLEMLATPADCVLFRHPLFEAFQPELFLSKQCRETFAGYAFSQIKKARGLNKKINHPVAPVRKTPLDFCYVAESQGAMPVLQWLAKRGIDQKDCGLVVIPNMRDLYGLYHDPSGAAHFNGILRKENANEVALSSVPPGMAPLALMSFNKDGYQVHCREYREYRDWEENRNDERYRTTLAHGKNYDAKNMMHTFRLLDMAAEILERGEIVVRRPNRDELLAIRRGDFSYEALVEKAEQKLQQIDNLYVSSPLSDVPDRDVIESLLISVRENFYRETGQ